MCCDFFDSGSWNYHRKRMDYLMCINKYVPNLYNLFTNIEKNIEAFYEQEKKSVTT